jgi:hypothetical protein
MNKIVKSILANTSRRRMGAGIFGAAVYVVAMLCFQPRHLHEGYWGLILLAALVWGFVESGRSAPKRSVVADARSRLKLS